MDIQGKVAIITGAGSGIGSALAKQFASDGVTGLVLADINQTQVEALAQWLNADGKDRAIGVRCDVSVESDIQALVNTARARFGRVDIYMSNAGILGERGGIELADPLWDSMWKIHGMAHVWAARAVIPEMVERGEGYFVVTASAAGLLTIVESAPYAVTKHASVAFAEWLRIAYGRGGVRVSCLCPQVVQTAMTASGSGSAGIDGLLQPEQVARDVVLAMRDETFLVLPHPEVIEYFRRKGQDYDRWLGGMQKVFAQTAKPAS